MPLSDIARHQRSARRVKSQPPRGLEDAAAAHGLAAETSDAVAHLGGVSTEAAVGPSLPPARLEASSLGPHNTARGGPRSGRVKRIVFASSSHVTGFNICQGRVVALTRLGPP